MMGLMLPACPYRIEEHHLKLKGCLPPICCFCMWLQQNCVVPHMGVNSQLGTPEVEANMLQCISQYTHLMVPSVHHAWSYPWLGYSAHLSLDREVFPSRNRTLLRVESAHSSVRHRSRTALILSLPATCHPYTNNGTHNLTCVPH
jgi:hypothetical protein